ncbi:putative aldouronate transport system permease protein [Lachnospiraceae bacterium NLAE-zl-G231]|nr:putative aldouronate transport system permease protein [Lachnospiraceae bacterium NLAE-zl-G231]
MKRKGFWGQVRKNRTLLCMLLPALLYVVIFSYIPMFGIAIAFKDYNYNGGILGSPWCGFKNFEYLKISGKLWALTRNTLLYNLAFIVFGIIFEVGFAVMLSEITKKTFKKVTQAFMFLPYFISWVVVSTIMLNIFGQNGVLSNVLAHFGIEDFSIYQQIRQWPVIMVAIRIWKQTGYGTVVYLAAIAGLSQEMFEAASIDGASIWQKIRYITIPGLKPTIFIMFLLSVGNIFRGDFGMFYQLVGNNQLLLETSDVIDTFVYRSLITSPNIGMSAAAGFYQSVLCFVTIVSVNWLVKKVDPDYTLF